MHLAYSIVVVVTLSIITLPATLACLYLLVLSCLSGRLASPPRSAQKMLFDIIVPAHDEAAGIGKTIASLQQVSWPGSRGSIAVVADNCTVATASVSRDADATGLERHD